MFNKKLLANLMIATGLVATSPTVLAQNSYYFGGNLASVDIDSSDALDDLFDDASIDDATSVVIYGRLGYQINDYFSAEIRIGTGNDDTADWRVGNLLGEIDIGVDKFYGAYLRAGMPVGDLFYPYLLAGYARAKLEADIDGYVATAWDNDISYGAGVDIAITDTLSGNIEYTNYYDDDGVEIIGFAIGLVQSF